MGLRIALQTASVIVLILNVVIEVDFADPCCWEDASVFRVPSSFYPFGPHIDTTLSQTDDGGESASLSNSINIFGSEHTTIYVSTNTYIC